MTLDHRDGGAGPTRLAPPTATLTPTAVPVPALIPLPDPAAEVAQAPATAQAPSAGAAPGGARHSRNPVDQTLAALFPAPCHTRQKASPAEVTLAEFLALPNRRRPRLLVPVPDRRLAVAALRDSGESGRLRRAAILAALRARVPAPLLRNRVRVKGPANGDTIETYLTGVLGTTPHISVHIGASRSAPEPMLQLLSPDGRTTGYAKVGIGARSRQRLRAEHTALNTLGNAGLQQVTVASVLHFGQWRDHTVLVQSALPIGQPRVPLSPSRLTAAMREVAMCCGTRRSPLGDSGYWTRLRARIEAVAGHPHGPELAATAAQILAAASQVQLEYGAWHGGWTPGHMASLDGTLLLWNWEHFTPGVPMGFDALHHELCRRAAAGNPRRAAEATFAGAAGLLRPFGVTNPDAVALTCRLYLLELTVRHAGDPGTGPFPARRGRAFRRGHPRDVLDAWLLPVLRGRVATL